MNDLNSINDEVSEVLKDLRNRVESSGYVLESVTMKVLGDVEGSWEWVTFTAREVSSPNVRVILRLTDGARRLLS